MNRTKSLRYSYKLLFSVPVVSFVILLSGFIKCCDLLVTDFVLAKTCSSVRQRRNIHNKELELKVGLVVRGLKDGLTFNRTQRTYPSPRVLPKWSPRESSVGRFVCGSGLPQTLCLSLTLAKT